MQLLFFLLCLLFFIFNKCNYILLYMFIVYSFYFSKCIYFSSLFHYVLCTALVVGSDDVASSYGIGMLTRRQVGRREGSRGLLKLPVIKLACSDLQRTRTGGHRVKDEVARCKPGDQVIAHRQR